MSLIHVHAEHIPWATDMQGLVIRYLSTKSRPLSSIHIHVHLRDVSPVWCKGNRFGGQGVMGYFPTAVTDWPLVPGSLSCILRLPVRTAVHCCSPLCSHHVTQTERFIHTTGARFMTEIRSTDRSNALCDWQVQTGATVWDWRRSVELI